MKRNVSEHAGVQPPSNDTAVFIYGLADPRNTAIRYVGKSIRPRQRYNSHLHANHLKANSRKNIWLRELLKLGLKPELVMLDTTDDSTWEAEEKKWIARLRSIPGYPRLTNIADGGQGHHNVVSEEERQRRAQARIGVPMPPGTGAKISAANKGKVKTPDARKKMSEGQKRRWANASEEDKKKMQNLPAVLTDELRKKISDGLRRVKRPHGATSIYRGVLNSGREERRPWRASCSVGNKLVYLGCFATEEAAARARDRFILERFPDTKLPLNFPDYDYSIPEPVTKRETLELSTRNSTGYQGVYWDNDKDKWACAILYRGKQTRIGTFPKTPEGKITCARTYDLEVIRLFGDSAKTNFPRANYSAEEIANASATKPLRENNKSGYRGVSWQTRAKRWAACFTEKGRGITQTFPGTDQGKIDAAHAYDRLAIQHKGRLARTNFPHSHYPDLLPPTP
jgi:AP2 domain